ncbi:MAG: DnaJ family domain-containing protein [Acidobacteriota bacterium]
MEIFSKIAEQKIREAIERGDFDHLENSGRPLNLEDETWIPEDLRSAYRVLKNAGCIPPELELRKEVLNLRELIDTIDDDKERLRKIRELNFKLMKLGEMRKRPLNLEQFPEYEEKIYGKLTE